MHKQQTITTKGSLMQSYSIMESSNYDYSRHTTGGLLKKAATTGWQDITAILKNPLYATTNLLACPISSKHTFRKSLAHAERSFSAVAKTIADLAFVIPNIPFALFLKTTLQQRSDDFRIYQHSMSEDRKQHWVTPYGGSLELSIEKEQASFCRKASLFSQRHPIVGRLVNPIVVPVVDTVLGVTATVTAPFYYVLRGILEIAKSVFSDEKASRMAWGLYNLHAAVASLIKLPFALAFAPVKLIYQLAATVLNGTHIRSTNFKHYTLLSVEHEELLESLSDNQTITYKEESWKLFEPFRLTDKEACLRKNPRAQTFEQVMEFESHKNLKSQIDDLRNELKPSQALEVESFQDRFDQIPDQDRFDKIRDWHMRDIENAYYKALLNPDIRMASPQDLVAIKLQRLLNMLRTYVDDSKQ